MHDVPLPIPVAGSFIDPLSWPQHEALLMLRNRSAANNIPPENRRTLTDRWEAVYSYEA